MIKKVTFGIKVEYTTIDGKIKKRIVSVPKWSEIKKSVPIKKGETTVMRMGEEFGIMCLDLDTKDINHPDFKLMAEKIYTVAPTVVQETPNGYHFLYKWNKKFAKTMAKITTNEDSRLDIKSNMGIVNIQAPKPYEYLYKWWTHTKHQEPAEFNDEAWEIIRPHLNNKYLGLPPTLEDEKRELARLVDEYEKNPTPLTEQKIKRKTKIIENWDKKRETNYNLPEIERAKQYPIRDLIGNKDDKLINCLNPNHDDKNPSMQITGNFAYCHGCGEHYDAIDIRMLQTGESFQEAVKFLNK